MRKLLLAGAVLLLMLPVSAMASTIVTLAANSTDVTVTYTGVGINDFTVTFPTTWSGSTLPAGTFSFSGVGPLRFGGDSSVPSGEPFITGTEGTLYLSYDGQTLPIMWTLLDGDGGQMDLFFTTVHGGVDSLILSTPLGELEALAKLGPGSSYSAPLSSGEVTVPEPATRSLAGLGMLGLLGLAGLRWKDA